MADITMPKMGFDMTEGTIVRWLKHVGDEVKKGESIAEIETDKVTIEIESFASGTISKIVAEEGAVVPVGNTIAILGGAGAEAAAGGASGNGAAAPVGAGEGGEAVAAPAQQTTTAASAPPADVAAQQAGDGSDVSTAKETAGAPKQAETSTATVEEQTEPTTGSDHVTASPVAKRLARENQIDIRQINGTGPGGRIVRRDIEGFLSSPAKQQPAPAPATPVQPAAPQPVPALVQPAAAPAPEQRPGVRREPMTRLRQTIARRLVQSKGPVPHFYVTSTIDMGAAMELRKQLNASGDVKITVNDLVVKAAAIALKKFPVLNASFADDALDYHDYIHISIAVATDNGLLAPAVTDVDKKSIGTISAEAKEMIGRAREGKATLDELQRGTFSTSNLGMYPVDNFIAIINPPQAAILAVGAVTEQPVVRNGAIVIGQIMQATISVDHRVSDGAVGAAYMQELKRILEQPMLILL